MVREEITPLAKELGFGIGKYWFIPKRFEPEVGGTIDFSKCYLICEFKLKERANEICQNSSQKSTDLKD